MSTRFGITAKRGFKVIAVLVLSLGGLALLPILALPYGSLDWLAYDPAYKGCYGFPAASCPAKTTPEIPCAEIPAPGDPLAARVNDQGIGLLAYERELDQFLAALQDLGLDLDSEEFQAAMPAYRRQVLDFLIEDVLIQQAAVEMGVTVTEEQIETRVAEAVAESGGLEAFQTWLDETGQTWEEFRRDICQDLLRQAVQDRVTAGMPQMMTMVHARQIVVATEQDAVDALSRLASGEAFEAVAQEVSLDDRTREQGGDLGWFPRGFGWTAPEVEEATFTGTLPKVADPDPGGNLRSAGQIQGPIQAGETYVIVQTVEYQENRPLEAETREMLRAIAFEQWLAGRQTAARIEIYVELDGENE